MPSTQDFYNFVDTVIVLMKAYKVVGGFSLWTFFQILLWSFVGFDIFWLVINTVKGGGSE